MLDRRAVLLIAVFTCSLAACSGGEYVAPTGRPAASASPATSAPATGSPAVSPSPTSPGTSAPTASAAPTAKPTPTAVPTNTPTPAPTPTLGTSVYVVDSSAKAVEVFPIGANGNVAPTYTISGSSSGLTYPSAATFDASGNLYVANYLTNQQNATPGNVVMFKPPFGASSTPAATVSYSGFLGVEDVAVDSSGNLYVLNYNFNNGNTYSIFVFAPGASTPTRTIALSVSDEVYSMAIDATTIYLSGTNTNQIYELPITSNGTVTPSALTGSATGLSEPAGLRIDYLDRLVVRNINNSTVSRFAAGSSGNVAPLSTFDISAFTTNEDETSLCLDGGGNVFVTHDDTSSSEVRALGFFPASDTGSVTPTRTITGSMTGIAYDIACAVR